MGEIDNGLGRLKSREVLTEDAAFAFAAQIGDFLDRHFVMNDFAEVVVVAAPRMAGRIHSRMTKRLSQRTTWIQKDLGKISDRHLPQPLGLPLTVLPGYARFSTRAPGA